MIQQYNNDIEIHLLQGFVHRNESVSSVRFCFKVHIMGWCLQHGRDGSVLNAVCHSYLCF
jgi:hypothetical protein